MSAMYEDPIMAAPLLAIAHFCDIHGPTPIMVTQVSSVPCFICIDCYRNEDDDQGPPKTRKSSQDSTDTDDAEKFKNVAQITSALFNSSLDDHHEKQKSLVQDLQAASRRRDSSFRKTYNEDDKKQASPCGNCALTVPAHLRGKIPMGAPGSGPGRNEDSPYLRTRRPVQRYPTPSESSSSSNPSSSNSDASDSDGPDAQPQLHSQRDSSSTIQQISFKPGSPDKNTTPNVHQHYLDYISTHTPLTSTTYTLIRNCCLRTLSTETLPPATSALPPTSPTLPYPSYHSTTSGGPIFFGDTEAGYTTAYIFRIPDPFARGRIRRYALMALDPSGQRNAMRFFSFLSTRFRELASWILELAEREVERLEAVTTDNSNTSTHNSNASSPGGLGCETGEEKKTSLVSYPTPLSPLLPPEAAKLGGGAGSQMKFKQTSSFLSGRTFEPDGYLRKGGYNVVRARGLAELVGMEEFFLELHRRFVLLLAQLEFY